MKGSPPPLTTAPVNAPSPCAGHYPAGITERLRRLEHQHPAFTADAGETGSSSAGDGNGGRDGICFRTCGSDDCKPCRAARLYRGDDKEIAAGDEVRRHGHREDRRFGQHLTTKGDGNATDQPETGRDRQPALGKAERLDIYRYEAGQRPGRENQRLSSGTVNRPAGKADDSNRTGTWRRHRGSYGDDTFFEGKAGKILTG